MSSHREFKVLIVGGSVAGLSLANMLEKRGISFTILEAYPEIAPQVGASIGLLPNGIRILDQLGVWEKITGIIDTPLTDMRMRHVQSDTNYTEIEDLQASFSGRQVF